MPASPVAAAPDDIAAVLDPFRREVRARARMAEVADRDTPAEPDSERHRQLLDAYLRAFETYDVAGFAPELFAAFGLPSRL